MSVDVSALSFFACYGIQSMIFAFTLGQQVTTPSFSLGLRPFHPHPTVFVDTCGYVEMDFEQGPKLLLLRRSPTRDNRYDIPEYSPVISGGTRGPR